MEYPIDRLLSRLNGVRKLGDTYTARCPSHDDKTPSLSVKATDDGKVLVFCHAGCKTGSVLEGAGLTFKDLFPKK